MSSENRKILIMDDEAHMYALVRDYLRMKGFQALETGDGREALEAFQRGPDIALILLDAMVPGMDGFETSKELRHTSDVPVLILTARVEKQDEFQDFSLDADEYITRPFSPKVLLARTDAVPKRTSARMGDEQLEAAGIYLDEHAYKATVDGKKMELSFRESELLRYFLENQGIALSREKILNRAWNYNCLGDARTIDTHVKKLRAKMGEKGVLIRTIWGMDYKFEPGEA